VGWRIGVWEMSKKQNKQNLKMWRSCRVFFSNYSFSILWWLFIVHFPFWFFDDQCIFLFRFELCDNKCLFLFLIFDDQYFFLFKFDKWLKIFFFFFFFSFYFVLTPALFFLFQFCDWVKVISIYYIYHPQTRWFKFHPPRRNWSFPRFKVAFKRGQAQEGDLI
jgi:hypothetical protein